MENIILEINRSDHGDARLTTEDLDACAAGQVCLRVDRFALTANNVTYAVAGDLLGYWDFFPADDGWGRVPAMGWGEVVESRNDSIAVGDRYFGWFPMATFVVFDANETSDGFRDDGPHREKHAPVYRTYVRTDDDPWYEAGRDAEGRHAVLRGLFLTGLLADEFFADEHYYGAEQVIVLSASSKTAIGFAQLAAVRDGMSVVGITSPANAEFVASLGCYDAVVAYDELETIERIPSVIIDMSGNTGAVASLHDHLNDALEYSMALGMSHHDAPPTVVSSGPAQQWFFAPTEVSRRLDEWGRAAYAERTTAVLHSFVDGSRGWMMIEETHGPEAAVQTWADVRNGKVAPAVGRVVSMHSTSTDDSAH